MENKEKQSQPEQNSQDAEINELIDRLHQGDMEAAEELKALKRTLEVLSIQLNSSIEIIKPTAPPDDLDLMDREEQLQKWEAQIQLIEEALGSSSHLN